MTHFYNDVDAYCCRVLRKNINNGNLPEGEVSEQDIRTLSAADLMGYQHVSLFAGIGGIPLGLARSGLFSTGIRTLSGGFPCQDISNAGKRAGITGERSGLWKEMVRLIQESSDSGCGFDVIVLENVAALTSRGLDTVLIDLAQSGYDAQWQCLRASDFGAPHRRERIFIEAYASSTRLSPQWDGRNAGTHDTTSPRREDVADTSINRQWQWTPDTFSDGALAHPAITGFPLRRQSRRTASDTQAGTGMEYQPERCSAMADTYRPGQQERDATALSGEQGHVARRKIAPGNVEDAAIRREWQHQTTRGTQGAQYLTEQSGSGQSQPRLGGLFAWFSDWVGRTRYPSGPGQPQHDWEPPRVTTGKVPHRVAQLRAYGNSVAPDCAEYVGRCILAALEAESAGVA